MADVTISSLPRITTTNTGALIPISVGGITSGIPVSGVLTASGNIGNGALTIPTGTTIQRPSSPSQGMMRFNTSLNALEVYLNGQWSYLSNAFSVIKTVYEYSGNDIIFTVPSFVTSISVKLWGAGGSAVGPFSPAGGGGYIGGNISVTSGQTLLISVGGGASSSHLGGFNGGGDTGGASFNKTYGSGGGGGYSGIFLNSKQFSNAIIIAGGGGAGGYDQDTDGAMGGPGGGLIGGDSATASGSWNASCGKGGTQSAGGAAGQSATGIYVGSQLQGGKGQPDGGYGTGGGGGGGYYGGGGGYGYYRTVASGGGGGGSSYFNPSFVSSALNLQGDAAISRTGNPGNKDDADRGTAGQGGRGVNSAGSSGKIVISYNFPQ